MSRVPELEMIRLDQIVPNELIIGPEPAPKFIQSVKKLKVFEPVFLQIDPTVDKKLFSVKAGGRRVKASRIAEHEEIKAIVYPKTYKEINLITLHENEHRSQNFIATYLIVEDMVSSGSSVEEIAEAMNKPISRVRDILRLDMLSPVLIEALKENKIKTSTALKAAKLDLDDQNKLVKIFSEKGTLTFKDVSDVRSCAAADLGKALPNKVFDMPSFGLVPSKKSNTNRALTIEELKIIAQKYIKDHPRSKNTVNKLIAEIEEKES